MRSPFVSSSLFLLATLFWICAGPAEGQTRPTCGCAFVGNQQPQNVRVVFKGETQPKIARPDMVVHFGDLIKVTRPVNATLICDNVTGSRALDNTPRNQAVPCQPVPEDGILIGRNGRSIEGTTMGDVSEVGFPIILSPRSTKILSPRPTLRWTSISNANTYRVTVRGDQGSWSTTVTGRAGSQIQEMTYPEPCGQALNAECAPPLTPGQSYKLIVEANNRSSEEEDVPNLGFSLLGMGDVQRLEARAAALNQLPVGSPLKTKALASLYANNGLNADAIRVLESHPISQLNPEAVRLLGNLYLRIGLPRKAETSYLKLVETSTNLDTPTGNAITNQTLGEIYELLGNRDEAIRYYRTAKRLYLAVNDQESMGRIDSRLTALGPR